MPRRLSANGGECKPRQSAASKSPGQPAVEMCIRRIGGYTGRARYRATPRGAFIAPEVRWYHGSFTPRPLHDGEDGAFWRQD